MIFQMLDEQEETKKMKIEINNLIDGMINTLVNEFGETQVSVGSSKKEKIAYLKRLY